MIDWPGTNLSLRFSPTFEPPARPDWFGALLSEQADHSGLLYRRNRYYDPQTGQFTQADPIGLAGGLNLYGFADGDPVGYSDPFGLCPFPASSCSETMNRVKEGLVSGAVKALGAVGELTGISGLIRAFSGSDAAGNRVGPGERVLELGLVALSAAGGAADDAARVAVQFGRHANQVDHTFRHVIRAGLDPSDVEAAVRQHLPTVLNQMQPGKTLNQVITVGGRELQYSAYEIQKGVINVGRIHPVP